MARGAVIEGNPELAALFDMVYRKVSEAKKKKQARGRGRARGGAKWGEADEETLLRSILDSASSSVGGGADAKRDKLAFLEAAIRAVSNRQSRVSDLPRFFLPEDATFADHMKLKAERLGRYKGVRSFDIELLASVTPPSNLKTYQLIDVTRPCENETKEPVSVAQFLISETDNYFTAVRATPSDPTEPDGFFAFSNVVLPSFFGKVHYMGIDSRYSTIGNVGLHTGILSSLVEEVLLLTPVNCRNISTYMEELLEFGMFFFGEVLRLQPPTDVLSDSFTHFPRPAFLTAEVLFYMRNWSYLSKVIFAFYLAIVEMSLDVSSRKDTYLKARKLMACAVHKFRKKGIALDLIGNHGFFTLRALAGRCLHLLKFDEGYVKKLIMRKNREHVGEIREIQLFSSAGEESKDRDSDDNVKDESKDQDSDDNVKDEDDDYLDDPKKIDEEYHFWKSLRAEGKDVIIKILLELDIDISDNHQGPGTMSRQQQQQHAPLRAPANGDPHWKLDGRQDSSKSHLMRSSSGGFASAENGGKLGLTSPSRDRLVYVMTQFTGHHVDVHVKNGSVISGIFHATNTDKDFGIVLKMAQLIKDTSMGGQSNPADVLRKPNTMIIPGRDLVQVFAKDVTLAGDELPKGPVHDKRKDLMIDSAISRSHFPEERELERWAPDEGDSDCIELEKFDRKGHRSWDQFETNAALFGVKSTFNEDLYTTKLERGPHMRELEKHASRIAREIEGEDTEDLHLAEERGIYVDEDLEQDEEIKYSAVRRDTDTSKLKSFMNVPSSAHPFDPLTRPGSIDTKDLQDEESSSHIFGGTHLPVTAATSVPASEYQSNKPFPADANRLDDKRSKDSSSDKDNRNLRPENTLSEGGRPLVSEDPEGASSRSRASEPSSSGQGDKSPDGLAPDSAVPSKLHSAPEYVNSSQIPGSSTSSTSERVAANSAASAPGLSPSSSMGSLSSDKSTLNPNAKEFKLNPNAKAFTPLTSPLRPPNPPAPDSTYYYPNSMPTTPGPGLPVGMGFPQAYGVQPMVYNAQPGPPPPPQGYMHPSGQQYGQQMMMGQTRPVYYYAPEMQQYRGGRNY